MRLISDITISLPYEFMSNFKGFISLRAKEVVFNQKMNSSGESKTEIPKLVTSANLIFFQYE